MIYKTSLLNLLYIHKIYKIYLNYLGYFVNKCLNDYFKMQIISYTFMIVDLIKIFQFKLSETKYTL